mgnify:CR=1 FL=1
MKMVNHRVVITGKTITHGLMSSRKKARGERRLRSLRAPGYIQPNSTLIERTDMSEYTLWQSVPSSHSDAAACRHDNAY